MSKIQKGPGDEGEDTTYVFSRAEDRSILVRLSWVLTKYKPILWAVALIAVSAGFDFRTPKQIFADIDKEIDSLTARDVAVQVELRGIEYKLDGLIKLRCFELMEKKLEVQARLAGLDCSGLLKGLP